MPLGEEKGFTGVIDLVRMKALTFVADGSVMPTQGSANPALSIMALASRLAERLARCPAAGTGQGDQGTASANRAGRVVQMRGQRRAA
mgnify:CR=1 FL=1